ncbi:MAG: hypothetical protein ACLQAT_22445 [Candidatus Binataceae bacterium]
MKIHRIANLTVLSFVLLIAFAPTARADDKTVPGWEPAVFRDASTIKIMTTQPDVGEHWSNLWVVVIDGQPYVRLGDRVSVANSKSGGNWGMKQAMAVLAPAK